MCHDLTSGARNATVRLANGKMIEIPYDEIIKLIEEQRPAPHIPVETLEYKAVGLLATLFLHSREHPVKLDGTAIGTTVGHGVGTTYLRYENGYFFDVNHNDMSCTFTVLTYVDSIVAEETIEMDGIRITGVAIHTLITISDMCTTTYRRYHSQLQHLVNVLDDMASRTVSSVPSQLSCQIETNAKRFASIVYK